jgi:urea transport system permease protein
VTAAPETTPKPSPDARAIVARSPRYNFPPARRCSRAPAGRPFVALIAVCALAPVLNLWVPEGSPLHLSDYAVALLGKIMCYAICALAMDLIWGYTGILSLGHGLFFALGGYVMGMYLMRQIGRDGNYHSDLPDFMVFLDWKELPWHWRCPTALSPR